MKKRAIALVVSLAIFLNSGASVWAEPVENQNGSQEVFETFEKESETETKNLDHNTEMDNPTVLEANDYEGEVYSGPEDLSIIEDEANLEDTLKDICFEDDAEELQAFTAGLPLFENEEAKDFLAFLYNDSDSDDIDYSQNVYFKIMTGDYDDYKTISSIKASVWGVSAFARTQLNQKGAFSKHNTAILENRLISYFKSGLDQWLYTDDRNDEQVKDYLKTQIEESIKDAISGELAVHAGINISEEQMNKLNIPENLFFGNDINTDSIEEYVKGVTTVFEKVLYPDNIDINAKGRYAYFSDYIVQRWMYETADHADFQKYVQSIITKYSELTGFPDQSWIEGDSPWEAKVFVLNDWAEKVWLFEKSVDDDQQSIRLIAEKLDTFAVEDSVADESDKELSDLSFDEETNDVSEYEENQEVSEEDFVIEEGVLKEYHGTNVNIIIPASVKEIGEGAFSNNATIESVTFPEGLESIGANGFSNCNSLYTINYPSTLKLIGDYAFYGCHKLQLVRFNDGLRRIGDYAYCWCEGLEGNLDLPESLVSIGKNAFAWCQNLCGKLTIPDSMEIVDLRAFHFSGFSQIEFGTGLKQLEFGEFGDWADLNACTIRFKSDIPPVCVGPNFAENPGIVDYLDHSSAFLHTIIVPHGTLSSYKSDYWGSEGFLKVIEETESDFYIEDNVLVRYLGTETDVVVPENVTKVGEWAFADNKLIKNIVLPDKIEEIGYAAFYFCTSLKTISSPSQLKRICDYAFDNCVSLETTCISGKVEEIERYAYNYCSSLKGDLVLPDSLKEIGDGAFYHCSNLSGTLVIPDCVVKIKQNTFYKCGFSDVIIGSGIEQLYCDYSNYGGKSCFTGCSNIRKITFKGDIAPSFYSTDSSSLTDSEKTQYFFSTENLPNLQVIYVQHSALKPYRLVYGPYLPSTVLILSDPMSSPIEGLNIYACSSKSVSLRWKSLISSDLVGYHVYRNNELIASTYDCSYSDQGLTTDEVYTYSVKGYFKDGRETPAAVIEAIPSKPEVLGLSTVCQNKIGGNSGTIWATVRDNQNLVGSIAEFSFRDFDGNKHIIKAPIYDYSTLFGSSASYSAVWDLADIEEGSYLVEFKITDKDGGESSIEKEIFVDKSRPDQLDNVIAIGDTNQIILNWSISHELDSSIYRIYRRAYDEDEYALLATITNRNKLSYIDKGVDIDKKYYYYVVAVNTFGQEGIASNIAVAIPQQDTETPVVKQMTPVNGSRLGGTFTITAQAKDNISVTRLELFSSVDDGESWIKLTEANEDTCQYQCLSRDFDTNKIQIKAVAYDAMGNESSPLIYTYVIDNQGPEKVDNVKYVASSTTATLSWDDVDDKDFSYFRVERKYENGIFSKVEDVYRTLGINIYNLVPSTEYVFRVVAYDTLGNRGIESDEITVITSEDTTAPSITAISPAANEYNGQQTIKIKAQDDTKVESITYQISRNGAIWEDLYVYTLAVPVNNITASYVIDFDEYEEGDFYIRGIAKDVYGNQSISDTTAPFVQYVIDRTAPSKPEGITAESESGIVEVKWNTNTDKDVKGYNIYRSTDCEDFNLLVKNSAYLNYWDQSVVAGNTYYYRVTAVDYAGNESESSDTVSITVVEVEDTEDPVIHSILPASGSVIGPDNATFSALISDDTLVKSVRVVYSVNDSTESVDLISTSPMLNNTLQKGTLPIDSLKNDDTVKLSVVVEDKAGKTTELNDVVYTVDKSAPSLTDVEAVGDEKSITVTWKGGNESDLAGYRVYRSADGGRYSLVAQRAASDTAYSLTDQSVSEKVTYRYRIEAVDQYGNKRSRDSESVWINSIGKLFAYLNVDATMYRNVEYQFDASESFADTGITQYIFNFGDGTTTTVSNPRIRHRYTENGIYSASLTVKDAYGNTGTVTRQITVKDIEMLGTVTVKVVNDSGKVVSDMPVYFDMDNTVSNIKYTGTDGSVRFVAEAGAYSIGAYKDGYLPVKKAVIVKAGCDTTVELNMVEEKIVSGSFEVERMTSMQEIVAAGINPYDPANQQIVRFNINLTYKGTPVTMKPIVSGNKIVSGGTTIVNSDQGLRKLTATVIPSISGSNSDANLGDTTIAILDVPVEASILKEFFDVKLHIINNANPEFEIQDNAVTLNIPEGLSLMKASGDYHSDSRVEFSSMKGQETKTISWVLRGDEIGEYNLEADYSGFLTAFDEPVHALFKTDTPIKVNGLSAIKLIADINTTIRYGAFYFDLTMENVSDDVVNLPNLNISEDLIKVYELARMNSGLFEVSEDTKVNLLRSILTNSTGSTLVLEDNQPPEILNPGEQYTKKYVAYNALTESDIAYLENALLDVQEGYGVEIEIIKTGMDLFNTENAKWKFKNIFDDQTKKDMYFYLVNDENFFYFQQANDDKNLGAVIGNLSYRAVDMILNLDWDLISRDNEKAVTRQYICEMLQDEVFAESIEQHTDESYAHVVTKALNDITKQINDTDNNSSIPFDEIKNNGENIVKLVSAVKAQGSKGFESTLLKIVKSVSADEGADIFGSYVTSGFVQQSYQNSLSSQLGKLGKIVSTISKVSDCWTESTEITNQLMVIEAAYEEAGFLMESILDYKDISRTATYEAVKEIQKGLIDGFDTLSETFCKEIAKYASSEIPVNEMITAKIASLFGVTPAGNTIKIIFLALKVGFGVLDWTFGWEKTVNVYTSLRVSALLSRALTDKIEYCRSEEGRALQFMQVLKNLIKLRLVAESSYVRLIESCNGVDHDYKGETVLNNINKYYGLSGEEAYASMKEYYLAYKARILSYRDKLFEIVYVDEDDSLLKDSQIVTLQYFAKTDRWTTGSHDFAYSDKFFYNNNYQYDNGLAVMSLGMVMAGYSKFEENYTEYEQSRNGNIDEAYDLLGFNNKEFHNYEIPLNDDEDKVAFSFATKTITNGSQEDTLLAVVIRGGLYGAEWSSNFHVGSSGNANGFDIPAEDVYADLEKYLETVEIKGNLKLWITGYSRGAAVANILAHYVNQRRLNNSVNNNNVYAYTFATPSGYYGIMQSITDNNIFNIISANDIVPKLALKQWGFTKYGKTMVLPEYETYALKTNYEILTGETFSLQNLNRLESIIMKILYDRTLKVNPLNSRLGYVDCFQDYFLQNFSEAYSSFAAYEKASLFKLFIKSIAQGESEPDDILRLAIERLIALRVGGLPVGALPVGIESVIGIMNGDFSDIKFGFTAAHKPEHYLSWLETGGLFVAGDEGYTSDESMRENVDIQVRTLFNSTYKKYSFFCPVDVEVYNSSGNLVADIRDNQVVSASIPCYVEGDTKSIYLTGDDEYSLKMTGNASGKMDYVVEELNEESEVVRTINYYDVPLEADLIYTGSADSTILQEDADYSIKNIEGETVVEAAYDTLIDHQETHEIHVNGGFASSSEAVPGERISICADIQDGYEFVEWTSDCDNLIIYDKKEALTTICMPDHDLTMTAVCEENIHYSIEYELDGGENNKLNIEEYKHGEQEIALYAPSKAGYRFAGWFTDEELTEKIDVIPAQADHDYTLYAKWEFLYEVEGYQVVLNGNFDLRLYMNISEECRKDSSTYVTFTVGSEETVAKPSSLAEDSAIYTCEVASSQLCDIVHADLYYKGECYPVSDYSIKTYLETLIENPDNNTEYKHVHDLAISLLNYGAYSQIYFNYNTDTLANESIQTDVVATLSEETVKNTITNQEFGITANSNLEYYGASLICEKDTALRIYFKNLNELALDQIKEKYQIKVAGIDRPKTEIGIKGNLFYVTVTDIPATALNNDFCFYIGDGSDDINYWYSPAIYIKKSMDSTNEKLKNLCKALFLYSEAANEYYIKYSMP